MSAYDLLLSSIGNSVHLLTTVCKVHQTVRIMWTFCALSLYRMTNKLLFPYIPTTSICMCMQYDRIHCETGGWCVATLSITVCARHVLWYTQCGTQHPHTDPHSQFVGVQCLLLQPALVFPSFPICHIVNMATERYLRCKYIN